MKQLAIALLLLIGYNQTSAQTVERGPYLQFPTSSSMKVMWRTDTSTPSRVYYGQSLATVMDNQVDLAQSVTNHTVNIQGLSPYTEYYYAVSDGANVLAGANENHRFRTSPVIGTVQPITAWVIGDFGKGNAKQMDVKDAFLDHVGDEMPDMWLWLGDNAYEAGTDEEFANKVFGSEYGYGEIFPRIPFMPTPGNHDYGSVLNIIIGEDPEDHDGPYYDIVDVPTNGEIGGVPSGYELYYSFDYGNVHFMSLNSEIGAIFSGSQDWIGSSPFNSFDGSPFTDWLHADLQANDKPWVVAFFHQPPHTDGSHDSDQFWEVYMEAMRENIMPILESYAVDLVLSGHSHVYERSFLLNGFYDVPGDFNASQHVVDGSSGKLSEGTPYRKYSDGPNPNHGTLYIVQGNSGSNDSDANLEHPAMYYGHGCETCVGSTMLSAHGDTLSGYYLTKDGDILDDWTIIKEAFPTGVEEVSTLPVGSLEVFPNPFENETAFTFNVNEKLWANVELVDVAGKVMHSFHSGLMSPGNKKYSINASNLGLAKGSYLVRVMTDKGPATARLIKVK
ncbi:MAG: metallophosphoesterase [Flavobacteriales bacterium]